MFEGFFSVSNVLCLLSIIFVDFFWLMKILLNKIINFFRMLKLHDRALCGVARGAKFRPSAILGVGRIFDPNYCYLALQYSLKINIS